MNAATWTLVAVVAVFTTIAAVCDYRTKRLPNWLTVPGLAAALVFHAAVGAYEAGFGGLGTHLLTAFEGFGVGFGILFVLWLIGGGGAGDVKLMGALGAWLGPWNTLMVFFVSTVFVMVLSAGALTYQMMTQGMGKTKRRYLSTETDARRDRGLSADEATERRKVRRRLLPYGVPVALASWVVLAWAYREQLFGH